MGPGLRSGRRHRLCSWAIGCCGGSRLVRDGPMWCWRQAATTWPASWRPVMSLLAGHVHVIAYDRAGLGGSAPSADPVILARQVRDLESVIISAAGGPCVLAGHSWGCILVQLLAWQRPDLVAGLVLVDPAHEQMTDALPPAARLAIRLARLGGHDEPRGGDTAASTAMLRELRRASRPFPTSRSRCSAPPGASRGGSGRTGRACRPTWPPPLRRAAISWSAAASITSIRKGRTLWQTRSCRSSPLHALAPRTRRPGQDIMPVATRAYLGPSDHRLRRCFR